MGQQQLVLIILGIIVIGLAITVGITSFSSNNASSNRDNLTMQLNSLGADAYGYYQKAKIQGGGGGTYNGYVIPHGLDTNHIGIFTSSITGTAITFTAMSKAYPGNSIRVIYDSVGKLSGTLDISNWNP